jgi:hypothetical protein
MAAVEFALCASAGYCNISHDPPTITVSTTPYAIQTQTKECAWRRLEIDKRSQSCW